MGTDVTHGAPYHPESQGAAEKAVGRVKDMIRKTGHRTGEDLQESISALNFFSSSRTQTGSPAMRLWGRSVRGPRPAPPGEMTREQIERLRTRHAELRDKGLARHDVRPLIFYPGDPVKIWDHRRKQNPKPALVDSPILGDNGYPRRYKVLTEAGRLKHVTAAWLVKRVAKSE